MQTGNVVHESTSGLANVQFSVELPRPSIEVLPGIQWGCAGEWFTPAFWKFQSGVSRFQKKTVSFCIGRTLTEEIAVCLLGGHGLPAELGLAAFDRLRERQLLQSNVSQSELESALSEPLDMNGRSRRYRFPRQKAKYLWHALQAIDHISPGEQPKPLRDELTQIPGIGPKTASWIIRNHFGSNDVAILDVHILRAGEAIGIFPSAANPTRDYFELEERFLEFCEAISEPSSVVDAVMWDFMRRIGPT